MRLFIPKKMNKVLKGYNQIKKIKENKIIKENKK